MKSKVTYLVEYGDWMMLDSEPTRPNLSKIDARTIHSHPFSSLDKAEEFAESVLKRGGKWLAYLRIKKVKTKLLQKLK